MEEEEEGYRVPFGTLASEFIYVYCTHRLRHSFGLSSSLCKSSRVRVMASSKSCSAQVCLGRPTRRTNAAVFGVSEESWKVALRCNESGGDVATLPKYMSCPRMIVLLSLSWPALRRTSSWLTREINDGGMRSIRRKQSDWKPSIFRCSVAPSHIVPNP